MTRIHVLCLPALIVFLILAAGCLSGPDTKGPNPLMTPTPEIAATSVPQATESVAAGQSGAAGTGSPGTCTADINSDPANCGGCGYTCPANAVCQQAQCFCSEGYAAENNQCVAVSGTGSGTGTGCPEGMTACGDGYCWDLTASLSNCGACGNACASGKTCTSGTCTDIPVEETTTASASTTTPTTTTSGSGSGSGTSIPGGFGTAKACFIRGTTLCGSACVNTSTSASNCGACGTKCKTATPNCCGGTCTNLKTDTANCGSCGNKCKVLGAVCDNGSCKVKAGKYVISGAVIASKPSVPVVEKQFVVGLP